MHEDLLRLVEYRKPPTDARKALPYGELEAIFRDRSVGLREKTLWRMLYETAARASEILALDVDDLDLARKRAFITSKGGDIDLIYWADGTARLLRRYLGGRTAGPLFLTHREAPLHVREREVCPLTGCGRLSYRRAADMFSTMTARLRTPPGQEDDEKARRRRRG